MLVGALKPNRQFLAPTGALEEGILCVCASVCLSVTNFLNCYKMANNGWISYYKVSIEAYGYLDSNSF